MNQLRDVTLACMVLLGCADAAHSQSIYTCIDGSGRKITSDRPIASCTDRDQKELNPSGTLKRVVKPVMTADEQRAYDARLKLEAAERARLDEEKRRDRALLARYPNRDAHSKERVQALTQVDEVILATNQRIAELNDQRKKLDLEMEPHKKDPLKTPPVLKRKFEDHEKEMGAQNRFLSAQEEEKMRINSRFDEEAARLKVLWAAAAGHAAAPATAASR